jgi:hypothetical protein
LGNLGLYLTDRAIYKSLTQLQQQWLKDGGAAPMMTTTTIGVVASLSTIRNAGVCGAVVKILSSLLVRDHASLETISYIVSYWLVIALQHLLHAVLVYGYETINTAEKYGRTLWKMYSTMSVSCVGSTCLNIYLRKILPPQCPPAIPMMGTVILFSAINYIVTGWLLRSDLESSSSSRGEKIREEKE